jgi:hypothetical protein
MAWIKDFMGSAAATNKLKKDDPFSGQEDNYPRIFKVTPPDLKPSDAFASVAAAFSYHTYRLKTDLKDDKQASVYYDKAVTAALEAENANRSDTITTVS